MKVRHLRLWKLLLLVVLWPGGSPAAQAGLVQTTFSGSALPSTHADEPGVVRDYRAETIAGTASRDASSLTWDLGNTCTSFSCAVDLLRLQAGPFLSLLGTAMLLSLVGLTGYRKFRAYSCRGATIVGMDVDATRRRLTRSRACALGMAGALLPLMGAGAAHAVNTLAYELGAFGFDTLSANTTIGLRFQVNRDIWVTHLGVYDSGLPGLVNDIDVGLWTDQGQLLTQAAVPPGTATPAVGDFRFLAIEPLKLTAGSIYRAGAFFPTIADPYRANPELIPAPEVTPLDTNQGYWASGPSLMFPTPQATNNNAAPNFAYALYDPDNINFDDLGLVQTLVEVGTVPVDIGHGFTLERAPGSKGYITYAEPGGTNSGTSGDNIGYRYLSGGTFGETPVQTLTRPDHALFDLISFRYHGWNNNFAASVRVSGMGAGGPVQASFQIAKTFTAPFQTATLPAGFSDLVSVEFDAILNGVTGNVFQIDDIDAPVSQAPAPSGSDLALNGSFESGPDPGDFIRVGGGTISEWTIPSGGIDYVGTGWAASDGARSVDLAGSGPGAIYQDVPTEPGRFYVVAGTRSDRLHTRMPRLVVVMHFRA